MSERQENEEIRAIYDAGSYSLATTDKSFQVDSARWHSWDEETRKNHIKEMRSYTPTPSDAFSKPSNVGRKPGSIIRRRKKQPTQVLVDRIQNSQETSGSREDICLHISKSPSTNEWRFSPSETENSNNIRFPDPCNDQPKIFELHMKKDLSKLVKRCQGNCGRVISYNDFLVVKSYGTIQWRETKRTEKSRFGPMYIHFQEKCLRGYEKDTYYGPGKRFDYSVIRVDEKCLT